jgi:nicotinamidase-related amidase
MKTGAAAPRMTETLAPRDLLPDPGRAALLVVDVQERLVAAMPGEVGQRVVRNAAVLLRTAAEFGMPALASEQYPRGLGPTVAEIQAALPEGVSPVEKVAFSCCAAPTFRPLLEALGQRDLILCGIEAHVCVLQTALNLLQSGRRVYVAADATCSRHKQNWRTGLDLMRRAGAVIGTTEIFVFALLGEAGTERFKRISGLVK